MMKRDAIFAMIILTLAASQAFGPRPNPAAEAFIDVSGDVTLLSAGAVKPEKDASEVVVWLVAQDSSGLARSAADSGTYRMLQHNKKFEPDLLVVPIGSEVTFPNLDPWFHNVFSLYRGKRFDLGLYQAGAQKFVRFDQIGPSYVFCNIHPQMTAVVLTVDSPFFGVTDKSGHVSIDRVPAGTYTLDVWYEDASPDILQALRRVVSVGDENRSLPAISIPVTKQNLRAHKNKYGRDYSANALAPKY